MCGDEDDLGLTEARLAPARRRRPPRPKGDTMRACPQRPLLLGASVVAALLLAGCFPFLPSQGGGQTTFEPPREADPADVALPPGYRIEVVATGLTFPTGVAFDDEGHVFVLEAGYSYGEVFTTPRLLRLEADSEVTVVAVGEHPPWNGIAFADGAFYVAGGTLTGGQLLRIERDGEISTLLDGLPSFGDHHTNAPAVADGWLYFGQGTVTNSAVVGVDNAAFGWLLRHPGVHDIPCEDVTLLGRNFRSADPLAEAGGEVVTGAFVPFGTPTEAGQVVPGQLPCNGAVMRVRTDGSDLELVAWGLRNPFGLAFSPDGDLYVSDNQYDWRGSRPVFGAGDLLWRISAGTWYGWPDFHAGRPLGDDRFRAPGEPAPGSVLEQHPGIPPTPVAELGVHSSSNGLDVSRSAAFGHVGDVFIAQFGDLAPVAGKVLAPVGFRVVRVEPGSGVVHDFAVNSAAEAGPASRLGTRGLERPVAARFDPDGSALYVVDFGVVTVGEAPEPRLGTGVLWRVTRSEAR
jgi:glucose/arabinose dehydrogenase